MSSISGDIPPVNHSNATNGSAGKNDPFRTPDPVVFLKLFTKVAAGVLALGLVAILAFALQDIDQFLSVSTTAVLLAAASLVLGLLAGFIFGIPSAPKEEGSLNIPPEPGSGEGEVSQPGANRQVEAISTPQPYRPNTNLERISDWLGTILVGIGLTQLLKVPSALESFGNKLKPALGGTDAAAWVAIGVLILFTVIGFLIGFLWTRVQIPELYTLVDIRQKLLNELLKSKAAGRAEGLKEGIPEGERKAIEKMADGKAIEAMGGVQETATGGLIPKGLEEAPPSKQILWVDDKPDKDKGLRLLIAAKMNVKIDTATSTDEAMSKMTPQVNVVISDMFRPEGRLAGFDFLRRLRQVEDYKQIPFFIYSGRVTSGQEDEIKRLGGQGITASPVKLMEMLEAALKPKG